MAANNPWFTVKRQFWLSNGPGYVGEKIVPTTPQLTAAPLLPSGLCEHNVTTVICASGFPILKLLGLGFYCELDPVQTGTPVATPHIHILLKGGLGGGLDYSITLSPGEVWAASGGDLPFTLDTDVTSIEVTGDVEADIDVYGIVYLLADI